MFDFVIHVACQSKTLECAIILATKDVRSVKLRFEGQGQTHFEGWKFWISNDSIVVARDNTPYVNDGFINQTRPSDEVNEPKDAIEVDSDSFLGIYILRVPVRE
jgi:hypothetical protein